MARKFVLKSSEVIHAPGIFRAAMNEIKGSDPQQQVWGLKILGVGFPTVPSGVLFGLMDGDVVYQIDGEKETVTLVVSDEVEKMIGLPKREEPCEIDGSD